MVTNVTTAPLAPGEQIAGRYTIDSVLGEGGMGTVFSATQAFTGRRVAVKVLHDQWASDQTSVQRFVQEARVVAQLSHPAIAQVLDGGVDAQHGVFVVMERLEGTTLQQWLDEHKRCELDDVRRWLVPVMNALAVAHDSDVLHRDVKPDNIFLARQSDGTTVAKLLDFGMSKLTAGRDQLVKTRTGAIVGTPWYMSPEQTRGDTAIDPRADVWSMGVVLYQCLSGVMPFEGNSLPSVIAGILTREPTSLLELRADLPPALCDVVTRAMKKNRDERTASMRMLADEVSRAIRVTQESAAAVAFAQTVPSSASVSQAIRAAFAQVQGSTPTPLPAPPEVIEAPVVPPSTIAIPAVVLKRVTAEAGITQPSAPEPSATQPMQPSQPTLSKNSVALDAPIAADDPPAEPPMSKGNPLVILLVTAAVVAVVVFAALMALKK